MIHIKLKKQNGKLVHYRKEDSDKYQKFVSFLKEGDVVDLYVEKLNDNGTLAQLAKVHAMIRELSKITGFSFSEMKLLVKEQAGLCMKKKRTDGKAFLLCKSFADCSTEELANAITACTELGNKIGHTIQ